MSDPGRTGLVGVPPQMGWCGVCLERAKCGMADVELGRPICPECVPAVLQADRVLWIAGWKGFGICRPAAGTLLDR